MARVPEEEVDGNLGGRGCTESGCGCLIALILKLIISVADLIYYLIVRPIARISRRQNKKDR